MAGHVDLKEKAKELRAILQQYNGIPSQKENKAAHLNIKYYVKTYPEHPEIKALIDEFNLTKTKYFKDFESHFNKVKEILEERKAMPQSSQEKSLYGFVKDFFNKYKDVPEVEKLKFQYAGPSCFPLKETKYGKCPNAKWVNDGPNLEWYNWKSDVAFEYVEHVWRKFGILPADNTKPMQEVKYKIHYFCRYNGERSRNDEIKSLFTFSKMMEDLGCKDSRICGFNNCKELEKEEVQERIRELLIENGACAIEYIARNALQDGVLPVDYIYYFYYLHAYYDKEFSPKMPLGRIYAKEQDFESAKHVLYVNYRDYHKCDVDKIRNYAQSHYRNWVDYPPKTLEEWKAYGQCCFFIPDTDLNRWYELPKKMLWLNWNETTIQYAFNKSIPYYYFNYTDKYLDFFKYLVEHNYTLTKSSYFHGYRDLAKYPQMAEFLKEYNINIED